MKTFLNNAKSYLILAFGIFVTVIGWTAFLITSEITGGGVTGISAILYFLFKIPVFIPYAILNIILVLIAIRILGASFGIRTVVGIGLSTFFFAIIQPLIGQAWVGNEVMALIIGGILIGAGTGIVIMEGGSTGGTDIIAMIVTKYRNITPGRVMLYCDIIIIGSSYFVLGSIEKVVYGLSAMAVSTYTVDMVLNGRTQSVQMFIISKEYEKIAERINNEVSRGVTLLHGTGWYSKDDKKVVMVLARKAESRQIFRIIKETDQNAFISQGNVNGVYGEGFDKIKL